MIVVCIPTEDGWERVKRKDYGDISNDAQQLANYSGMPVIFSHNYVRIVPYITPFSFAMPWNNPWDIAYPRSK